MVWLANPDPRHGMEHPIARNSSLKLLDLLTPSRHNITGLDMEERRNNSSSVNRILFFVMAVTIHKLPAGMAPVSASMPKN